MIWQLSVAMEWSQRLCLCRVLMQKVAKEYMSTMKAAAVQARLKAGQAPIKGATPSTISSPEIIKHCFAARDGRLLGLLVSPRSPLMVQTTLPQLPCPSSGLPPLPHCLTPRCSVSAPRPHPFPPMMPHSGLLVGPGCLLWTNASSAVLHDFLAL